MNLKNARMKISVFPKGFYSEKFKKIVPSVKPIGEIEFFDYLNHVKNGYYEDEVLNYRAGRIDKSDLPGVTPSGTFTYRSTKNLKDHSGIIVIDIDKDDQLDTYDYKIIRARFRKDPYIYACHLSCSGDGGLAAYVRIDPTKHLDAFLSLEKYFADNYRVIIDPSGKDVSRFRYVSYDPDLYINEDSQVWKNYIPKAKREPHKHNYIFTDDDISHVFNQIRARQIDLTFDYHDWFRVACALSDYYGAAGINRFHEVSSISKKYDPKACDKLYNLLLKRNNSGVKIGTFLWMAKQSGVEIQSPKTQMIVQVSTNRKRGIGKSGGSANIEDAKKSAIKYLSEFENIGGKKVEELVGQIMESPDSGPEPEEDIIAQIRIFLNTKNLKFNEVTSQCEVDGEPITDRIANTLYIEALENVSKKVRKEMLNAFIESKETKAYHPFKSYFEGIKHLKPTGNVDKLIDCIDANNSEHVKLFLRKWLLSIVASAHGTYSLMILVLAGEQSTGKTKFFRELMPDPLMRYYGESKLDDGKDSEILMTQKLLIVDDEFSGKSKRDYKKLKDLSSKQWFNVRKPYGRHSENLRRYAVLAGTSNEDEVINDPTGNRRIIPINVNYIDHEKMATIDKNELWAELYHEWKNVQDGWMLTKEDIRILNDSSKLNTQPSLEQELISQYWEPTDQNDPRAEFITTTGIKLKIENDNLTVRIQIYQIPIAMKALGFEKIRKRIDGEKNPSRVYVVRSRPKPLGNDAPYSNEPEEELPF